MIYTLFAVLIFMTALPTWIDRKDIKIVPDFWRMCFPVLLYITGAYIRYFQPTIKHRWLSILIICAIYLQFPILNYLKVAFIGGDEFANLLGVYYALPNYIAMTLVFLHLYKLNIRNHTVSGVVTKISLASYEMYLFSYMCDRLIYPVVMNRFYTDQSSFTVWFLPITLTVVVMSYILSTLYRKVYDLIGNRLKRA